MALSASQIAEPSKLFVRRMTSLKSVQRTFLPIGQFFVFAAQTVWLLPVTVRRYGRETLRAMNNLAWGRGSIVVDGGVISVLILLGIAIGGSVAVEAFATLNLIGFGALSGIVGGLANVRDTRLDTSFVIVADAVHPADHPHTAGHSVATR